MYIKEKNVYGYYNYQDRWDEGGWWWSEMFSGSAAYFENLEDVKVDLDAINTLIDSDFSDICDRDFYYLISRFYSINLTIKELLNIISRVNSCYYDKFELLNSRQTFCISKQEGHGKDLNLWSDKYLVRWIVATTKDFNLNPNYNYSKDEIEKMILNKQIVAIARWDKKVGIDSTKLPYQEEEFEDIKNSKIACDAKYIRNYLYAYDFTNTGNFNTIFDKPGFDFDCLKEGENNFSKNIYKEACSMIRIRLNKEQVLKICEQIVLFLKDEIDKLFPRIQESYFCIYSNKEKYLNLAKELKDINNILLIKLEKKKDDKSSLKVLKMTI